MKVLIAAASRHGATLDIGAAIRDELQAAGHAVDLIAPERVDDVRPYDAVVIGSAVYAGRWLPPARELVERFEALLGDRSVWLFSSGPIGDPAKPAQPPSDGLEAAHRLNAVDHQVFEGRLDPGDLGFGERAVIRLVGAPSGDYRPWAAIRAWATRIGDSLRSLGEPGPAEPALAGAPTR